jgi:hypothetical protein
MQLTHLIGVGDLHNALAPTGDRLALVVRNDEGLDLMMVRIPGGEVETLARLISFTREAEIQDPTSAAAFAAYAIRDYDSVAWQPGDGRWLAFIGALEGPTADLYLYDTTTGDITQLTDGPSQAVLPNWSPNGAFVVHAGVSWVPPFGGAIVGANQLDGVWAVRVADGQVIEMPAPAGIHPNFVGWLDETHYMTYDSDDDCYARNLRSVDVSSGQAAPVADFSFYYEIALSPQTGALLISSAAGCPSSLGEGVFILLPGQTAPAQLLDRRAYEVRWLPESRVFLAYPEALISADGQTRYEPPVYEASYQPALSLAGYQAWEVIENRQGRVVVEVGDGEWQTILSGLVDQLIWDPVAGQTLLIVLDDGSLYAAAYPEFEPRLVGNLGSSVVQAGWVP